MKKNKLFWKIYTIATIVGVVSMCIILVVLWDFLKYYENTEPKYEMDKVLAYFNEGNYEEILSHADVELSEFEDKSVVVSYLQETLKDVELTYSTKAGENTKSTPVYTVYKDKSKVATVHLKKEAETTKYGFPIWQMEKVDNIVISKKDISIVVPSSAKVSVNGILLTDDYIDQRDLEIEELSSIKKYFTGPTMVKYKVAGLIEEPNIEVIDSLTNTTLQVAEKTDSEVKYGFGCTQALINEVENTVIDISKKYSNYVTNDARFSAIQPYLLTNTSIYEKMSMIAQTNIWYTDHSSVEFRDMKVSNYNMYSDKCYSCEVSFNHVIHGLGSEFSYPTIIKYYFVKINNKWYIADLQTK